MSLARNIGAVMAGLVGGTVVGCLLSVHASTNKRLIAAKAAFARATPTSGDASPGESNATWQLGRMLFNDPGLSKSGRTACATCHQVGHGWSDANTRAIGDGGKQLAFKSPALVDVGSLDRLGWTGRFGNLSAVSTFALTSPNNMGSSLANAANRLRQAPAYVAAFRAAFHDEAIDDAHILHALSAYVTSISLETPFDRWIAGDENAMDDGAKRGFATFVGRGRCAECHSGPSLTDGSFHDIGSSTDDLGRGKLFKTSVKLQYAFKTPSLRGVADRAPYMHDGSKATLEQVVDLYDRGGIDRPSRADVMRPLHLSAGEKADLIAFLKSLSGEPRYVLAR